MSDGRKALVLLGVLALVISITLAAGWEIFVWHWSR